MRHLSHFPSIGYHPRALSRDSSVSEAPLRLGIPLPIRESMASTRFFTRKDLVVCACIFDPKCLGIVLLYLAPTL